MNMKKRLRNVFLLLLVACNVKASEVCVINKWFDGSLKSRDVKFDLAVKDTDGKNILLSQLPSVSLSAGKSITEVKKSQGLINIKNYSPEISASLNLYAGGRTVLDVKENNLEHDLLKTKMLSEKNLYIYNLLSAVFSLKTISENKKEIAEQIKILKKNEEVYKYLVESGKKPKIELELINSGIEDLKAQFKILGNNYKKMVAETQTRLGITENELMSVNYSDFHGCIEHKDIQINQKEYTIEKMRRDIHIKRIESQILPDVTLSFGVSPGYDEKGVNYHRLDYQMSVALTFNLASAFKMSNDKQSELIRSRQNELHFEDSVVNYLNKKNEIDIELKNIDLQTEVVRKNIVIEERKLNYVKEQLDSGRESFLYYIDMLNRMLLLKSRMSDLNNQRIYYEVLSDFYN
ncbi:TolC family protein [Salmonella enterica]|nr:TolC family protein [Salmonella enterica]